ncbi:DUF1661 domain-containing protein [Porphyromonas gingivalis]|nr:DUF1661 domain-containing protein [Porphyromonas gingivalis]
MLLLKTRFVNFFILAWEVKNSHATTKKISRHNYPRKKQEKVIEW